MTSSFRPGMAKMPQRPPPKLAQAQPISTVQSKPQIRYQPQPTSQQNYQPKTFQPQPTYQPKPQPNYQPQPSYSQPQPVQRAQPTYQPTGSGGAAPKAAQYNSGAATVGTLKIWASQQAFLDIYQVNAFYTGTAQRSQYFMSIWKTATCFGLQFIGILLLMGDQWAAYTSSSAGSCGGIRGNVAFVGYFFATYITMFCTEQIRSLNRYGMYGWGEQQPDFVNPLWVAVGLWVNLISLFLSWFVSCIIIFTSEDVLNMVLNSVAVTFMLTLDDEIIGSSDYNRIAMWDGQNHTACRAINDCYRKLGGILLKIHPVWQRRIQFKQWTIDCCDCVLCPFMIIIPFIVLFCYPYADAICLYEEDALCG